MNKMGNDRGRTQRNDWRSSARLARSFVAALGLMGCGAEPGDAFDEDVGKVQQAVTSQVIDSNWACPNGSICEDTYEIDLLASSEVTITVNSTSSTIRLGAFAPGGLPGSRKNLLTGNAADRRCAAKPATDQVTFRAITAGRYKFTFGRDTTGSTSNGSGTYRATVSSNNPFTFVGRSTNDTTVGVGFQCKYQATLGSSWNCQNGCEDRYTLDVRPGTQLMFSSESNQGSTVRLAVFGQNPALRGINLVTGTNQSRKCKAEGVADRVVFTAVDGGQYTFAIGREAGGSAGVKQYLGLIESSDTANIPIFGGQVANDVALPTTGARCGYSFTTTGTWSCPAFFDCQNYYDFDLVTSPTNPVGLPTSTPVDISITNVTGNAAPRLAVITPPSGTGTLNLLNNKAKERQCAAVNGNDFVTLPANTGRKRFSIGRVGAATPITGTYRITLTTPDAVLTPRGQSPASQLPIFGVTSCP